MTTFERSIDWLEKIGDRANPILVKETRQALKSRQFVVTFMLLLAASWFLFMMGILLGGDALEYGAIGTQFFTLFYWILAFAVMVIVPFGAYRSLLTEKDQTTFDLLSITTLTPRQIVWGKLLSALVQVLIFYSAIAPFIAFTSLLQGFDFFAVMFRLVMTLLLSLLVAMVSIASSAMTKQRQWQSLASMVMLAMLVIAMMMLLMPVEAILFTFNPADPEGWWLIGMGVAIAASYFLLCQQIAIAHLTFEADNRTTGIRLVCSGQFLLLWGAILAATLLGPSTFTLDQEVIATAAILSLIHWAVVGLFAVTEEPYLFRRVRRGFPKGRLRRILASAILSGGHRGYLYFLLHLGLLAAIVCVLLPFATGTFDEWETVVAFACYVVIYLGMACVLGRWCMNLSADLRPGHVRVLTLIIAALAGIIPMAVQAFVNWGRFYQFEYSLLLLPNPMFTLPHISDHGHSAGVASFLLILAAGFAILVNVPAMKRGVAEVVLEDIQPSSD